MIATSTQKNGIDQAVATRKGVMLANWKSGCVLLALTGTVFGSFPASAITAELARKCSALTAKKFPPRTPGNPAAGSAKGSGRDQRAYYSNCVANGGKVDDETK
jgi:hypothetical protein